MSKISYRIRCVCSLPRLESSRNSYKCQSHCPNQKQNQRKMLFAVSGAPVEPSWLYSQTNGMNDEATERQISDHKFNYIIYLQRIHTHTRGAQSAQLKWEERIAIYSTCVWTRTVSMQQRQHWRRRRRRHSIKWIQISIHFNLVFIFSLSFMICVQLGSRQ